MTLPEPFEDFVRANQDIVYSTAIRLLGSDADAKDVSQQTFLRAWTHWIDLERSPTATAWLRTVARNLCLNHLSRYRSRWRFFSELTHDDHSNEERELPFAVEETPPQDYLEEDQCEIVEDAIEKLPTDQRVALVLYHFEDLDYLEIAKQLGVSLGKVKTDIHRARAALKKKLQLRVAELGV